ncbi:site-specific integrase [Amphibacillus sp. Q70]|uniref:site-specific integrase n=1 Tax=Amphibacillus sp. Q70 TaxID=3453416 RepID=UPI003F836CA6
MKEQKEEQQLMVLLALTGGLRRGEIAGIASDVCNFDNNSILIKRSLQYSKANGLRLKGTKTEDTRTVILSQKLMQRLQNLYTIKVAFRNSMGNLWEGFKDVNGKEVLLLFSNEYGKPYRPDSITQFWDRFTTRNKDELRKIRFHDLRHSSATYILSEGTKEGLNMKTVQKRLGHKNIKTTLNLYSHVTDQDDEATGKLFDDLFS